MKFVLKTIDTRILLDSVSNYSSIHIMITYYP